jgi:hypothetical protein
VSQVNGCHPPFIIFLSNIEVEVYQIHFTGIAGHKISCRCLFVLVSMIYKAEGVQKCLYQTVLVKMCGEIRLKLR